MAVKSELLTRVKDVVSEPAGEGRELRASSLTTIPVTPRSVSCSQRHSAVGTFASKYALREKLVWGLSNLGNLAHSSFFQETMSPLPAWTAGNEMTGARPVGNTNQPITVFIADDQPEVRRALRRGFERDGRLEIVGEADDGEKAIREIESLKPDALILDLAMPRTNGLEALPEILRASPATKIIVFSTLSSFHGIEDEAKEKGAHLVVDKYTSPRKLVKSGVGLMKADE